MSKKRKPLYKRWWFIAIVAFFIVVALGLIFESDEAKEERLANQLAMEQERQAKTEKKEAEKEEKELAKQEEKERKEQEKMDQKLAEKEKKETEQKEKELAKQEENKKEKEVSSEASQVPYTKEQEEGLLEAYNKIIEESEGIIVKIEQEDDYEIINVFLQDEFKYLDKNIKQALVDEWGNKIENNTRSRLFGTGIKEFKYVYFKNLQGEYLADTNHFDRGWKVKE